MKRVLKSFGMEAGQMEKSKDDIWCGLSKFLSEIIEKYAENLEKDLRGKNSTSITVSYTHLIPLSCRASLPCGKPLWRLSATGNELQAAVGV